MATRQLGFYDMFPKDFPIRVQAKGGGDHILHSLSLPPCLPPSLSILSLGFNKAHVRWPLHILFLHHLYDKLIFFFLELTKFHFPLYFANTVSSLMLYGRLKKAALGLLARLPVCFKLIGAIFKHLVCSLWFPTYVHPFRQAHFMDHRT